MSQGPSPRALKSHHLPTIHSTWEGEHLPSGIQDDTVIQSRLPRLKGRSNVNLQATSTLAGLYVARDLGATHVLKTRSDMEFSDTDALVKILSEEDDRRGSGVWFLDYVLHRSGYFMDFIQFGAIDHLVRLWSLPLRQRLGLTRFAPEEILTRNFESKFRHSVADGVAFKKARFMLPLLYENGIILHWSKRGITSDDWRGNPIFVCASSFRPQVFGMDT